MLLQSFLDFFLFVAESFLTVSNATILLGLRMLPLKDVPHLRNFIMFDILTTATTILVVDNKFWIMAGIHMVHHLYCYLSWDVYNHSKKVSNDQQNRSYYTY